MCSFKEVMHSGLHFYNNMLIKLLICFSIYCFYVNTIILSLVYVAFVDQDDSASGGNPQTMGLVRIKQVFLLYYFAFFKCEKYCVLHRFGERNYT